MFPLAQELIYERIMSHQGTCVCLFILTFMISTPAARANGFSPADRAPFYAETTPSISRTRHFYEVVPQTFFHDLTRLEEITKLHEGGIKLPFDEKFMFRLQLRSVNWPGKMENVNFAVSLNYAFDGGKGGFNQKAAPEEGEITPSNQVENARLFSYLIPPIKKEDGGLLSIVLKYESGSVSLTPEHKKVLKGLSQYLRRKREVFVVITGGGDETFEKRREILVRYMIGVAGIKREWIKGGGEGGDHSWIELRIEEF